jgi:hypothetical protein
MKLSTFSLRVIVSTFFISQTFGFEAKTQAADPELSFDFARTLACRDVTPAEFAELYPGERIVEATLRLSVYLESGDISEVKALRIEISDCDSRLRVHDFSPRTRLESEYAGDIEVKKTTESSHTLGASLGGEVPCIGGGLTAQITPSINGGLGGKEVVTESTKRVAPKQTVCVSGTMNEEHGVFFTLRPSPTSSLEGVHELTIQFVAPARWRGDAVRVSCVASGEGKVLWMKQQKNWAQKSVAVALYLDGDAEARRAAQRLVRK